MSLPRFWLRTHLLAIEVADTSLDYDRGIKLSRYAAAGVPEVWIVDLHSRRLEIYRAPREERYSNTSILEADEEVAVPADGRLTVADILPAE